MVVVVVIIVLLAGLYAASVGPFSKSGSGSSTGAGGSETFSQAASTATPSASGVSGGPWTLVGGVGALAGSSFTTNASYFESEATTSGCGGKLLSGASSITSFPSSSNAPGSGATPFWLVLFKNSSGGVLEVAVISGTATPVVTFTAFGSCGNALSLTQASSYIDSPQAAADAMDYGGNTFASAHSAFYTIYVLVPGDSLTYSGHVGNIPPSWEIELTNCNPAQTTSATLDGKAPAQFHASLNVTTGKLITATNDTAACVVSNPGGGGGGGKPSLSSTILVPFDFIETNNSNTTSPVYWNNGTFVSSWSGQFTIGEFTVAIENNTTGAPISTAGLTLNFFNITNLINGTGVADAVYHFGTNTWSSNTALVGKIQNHDFFEVISSASLAGDKLVITATSAAPVSGSYAGILAEY